MRYLLLFLIWSLTMLGISFSLGLFFWSYSGLLNLILDAIAATVLVILWWRYEGRHAMCLGAKGNLRQTWRLGSATRIALNLLCIAGISGAAVRFAHSILHRRVDALTCELRARGWPSSFADLQKTLPGDQYGFPMLPNQLRAEDLPWCYGGKAIMPRLQKWDRKTYDAFHAQAKRFEHLVLDVLPMPAKYARMWRLYDEQLAVALRGPRAESYGNLTSLTRALVKPAADDAFEGNAKRSWDDVRTILGYSELFGRDHFGVDAPSALFGFKFGTWAATIAMLTQPTWTLPKDVALHLRRIAAHSIMVDDAKSKLAYLTYARDEFELHGVDLEDDLDRAWGGRGIWITLPLPQPVVCSRQGLPCVTNRQVKLPGRPFGRPFGKTGGWDMHSLWLYWIYYSFAKVESWRDVESAEARFARRLPCWPFLFTDLDSTLLPVVTQFFRMEYDLRDWIKLALLTSAANEFRNIHGRYPAALSDLDSRLVQPSDKQDVFTGREFEYTLAPNRQGFSLCSPDPQKYRRDYFEADFCVHQHI